MRGSFIIVIGDGDSDYKDGGSIVPGVSYPGRRSVNKAGLKKKLDASSRL